MFSESQFERYWILGVHTMEKLCADRPDDLRDFVCKILADSLEELVPLCLE